MMRVNLFVLLLTASLFSCSFTGKQLKKTNDVIYWSKDVKLTWEDFKGNIKELPKDKGAISNITIDYTSFDGNDVRAIFNKKKSIKDKRFISDYGLIHEQYHFNIAELFVRKYRKKIQEKTAENSGSVSIFQTMQSNHKFYQDLYDKETQHSTNEKKQKEWEEKIDKELAELEEFTSE